MWVKKWNLPLENSYEDWSDGHAMKLNLSMEFKSWNRNQWDADNRWNDRVNETPDLNTDLNWEVSWIAHESELVDNSVMQQEQQLLNNDGSISRSRLWLDTSSMQQKWFYLQHPESTRNRWGHNPSPHAAVTGAQQQGKLIRNNGIEYDLNTTITTNSTMNNSALEVVLKWRWGSGLGEVDEVEDSNMIMNHCQNNYNLHSKKGKQNQGNNPDEWQHNQDFMDTLNTTNQLSHTITAN